MNKALRISRTPIYGEPFKSVEWLKSPRPGLSPHRKTKVTLAPFSTSARMGEVVGETVTFADSKYTAIREGHARILTPCRDQTSTSVAHKTSRNNNNNTGVQSVFYNRIQQFNRDLSVLAILVHGEGAVIEKEARLQKKLGNSRRQKGRKKGRQATGNDSELPEEKPEVVDEVEPREEILEESTHPSLPTAVEGASASSAKRKRHDLSDGDDQDAGDAAHVSNKKTHHGGTVDGMDASSAAQIISSADPDRQGQIRGSNIVDDKSLPTVRHKIQYTILDALSATGLRALRYAKEIPFVTRIIANDLSPEAVRSIGTNVKFNQVDDIVKAHQDDARAYMYGKVGNESSPPHNDSYVHRFDVIDLDPYGTAAPFFDSALQALQDGGLLCVTCTDAGVFASNGYPEKAFALYAGTTMKGVHSHEGGLRLILHAISLSAAKYGIAIEPLLSLSIDFYARLFIRIHKRPHEVKLLSGTSMLTYNCDSGCGAWKTQKIGRNQAKQNKAGETFFHHSYSQAPSASPNCEHCGFKTHLAGPMWAGPLHNPFFIRAILAKLPSLDREIYGTVDRLEGMLRTAIEEDPSAKLNPESDDNKSGSDTNGSVSTVIPRMPPESEDSMPFFFVPTFTAKVLHTTTPSEAMLRSAFLSLGYHVTRSHCKPGSFKTNAPWTVIWEILREWVRKGTHVREGALKEGMAGFEIMKRARGTDSAKVYSFKEGLAQRLGKVSQLDDLKAEMEAAMFRLKQLEEQTQGSDAGLTNGYNGEDGIGVDNKAGEPEKPVDKLHVVFDEKLGKENKEKLRRYQVNMPHWGPMNRATGQRS